MVLEILSRSYLARRFGDVVIGVMARQVPHLLFRVPGSTCPATPLWPMQLAWT